MKRSALWLLPPCAAALLWAVPFAWMALASLRQGSAGSMDLASLLPVPPFSLANFADAWSSGHFPRWYANTIILCGGILAAQCVTVSLAGYAFARLRFRGKDLLFYAFLLQLMLVPPILIVPNMSTLVSLHLYDTLAGVMAPYVASAFGVFLMRQTFRTIPREYEEARSSMAPPVYRSSSMCCCRSRGRGSPPSPSFRSPRIGTSSCGR